MIYLEASDVLLDPLARAAHRLWQQLVVIVVLYDLMVIQNSALLIRQVLHQLLYLLRLRSHLYRRAKLLGLPAVVRHSQLASRLAWTQLAEVQYLVLVVVNY